MTQPTPRQLEVLRLIWSGLCRKQVAHKIGVTENTIWWHLENMRRKTRTETNIGLCRWALRRKLIEL